MVPRMLTTAVVSLLGFYVAFLILVYLTQSSMLYLPGTAGREPTADPAALGLAFEDVHFATADGERLNGWLVQVPEARGTLLFFHGNAGNIGHRLDSISVFTDLGLNVFIFDYRGYGRSSGRPSEQGTYEDGAAAWRWLTRERGIAPQEIVLFGRSLGGAVAAELATRADAAGLIVESCFTSVPDLGAELYPLLPVRLLSRFRYDTLAAIARVEMPLLVVHSRGDEIIPFRHGRRLFEAAREPKAFLEIAGGHNEGYWLSREAYRRGLAEFLDGLEPEQNNWREGGAPGEGTLRGAGIIRRR